MLRTHTLLLALTVIATTVVVAGLASHGLYVYISRPQPVSGPLNYGYDFPIVGMNGSKPVLLSHEWGGNWSRFLAAGSTRRGLDKEMRGRLVWADTGRATGTFRYYLTPADLRRANDQLGKIGPGTGPRVAVSVLDNGSGRTRQTLRVTLFGDRTDIISVYRVEDERVRPLAWSHFRPETVGISMLPVTLFIFAASVGLWDRLLRKRSSSTDD